MARISRWRAASLRVIERELIKGCRAGDDDKTIMLAIRDAYPFGVRDLHPYRVWLKEQRKAGESLKSGMARLLWPAVK